MELFFQLFSTGIPNIVLIYSIGLGAILTAASLVWKKRDCRNYIVATWAIIYLFLILYTTVFRREAGSEYQINLIPFWSIGAIKEGYIETFYEKIYNILLFVPLGAIVSCYRFKVSIFKQFIYVALFGACSSIIIEFIQLITKTGMCETDDVICNTIGTMIGAGLILIGKKIMNGK